jgi:hypothetical protein
MNNRTIENDDNNSGQRSKKDLENEIRIAWQELVDNYRTYAVEIDCDIRRARELLDGAE